MRKFHGKLQTVLLTLLTLALIAGAVFATSAFAATADDSDTNDASTWWIWVLLAVVIILNIVIILLLLLRGKDEEQTTAESEDTPRESEPADEERTEEGDEDETSDEEDAIDEEESVEEEETPEETEEKETFDEEDTLDEDETAEEDTLDEDETPDEDAAESTENDDEEEPFVATVAQKTQSDEETSFALPTIEETMVLDKSFEARLSQADESVKNLYDAVTTELLSYKNVRCRTSWKFQAFYKGRRKCAMLQLRGKKLCLYLALDAANLAPKYHAKDVSGKARYQQVPTLVSVSGKRALQYAQQLVAMMMTELGAERGTTPAATPIPYKSTQTLIDEGLIKYKAAGRGFPRTTARSTATEQTPTDESDDEKD